MKQTIGIGAVANDGTGDTPRDAFDKVNDNFTELYEQKISQLYNAINPSIQSDPNWQPAVRWEIVFDGSTVNPGFTTLSGHSVTVKATNGLNNVDQTSKHTFIATSSDIFSPGSGQRICVSQKIDAIGNGDAILVNGEILYYGGLEDNGGEGMKFERRVLDQGRYLYKATITAVEKAAINTTTTQAITKSKDDQVITVADATGVSVGQWICVDVGAPTSVAYAKCEAVKVLAVSGNNITARFSNDHLTGAIVRGATVLRFNGGTGFGQGRYCVNLTRGSYSTGTAKGVSNTTGLEGSGVSWSNSMVGGSSLNPGVISFDADAVTASPFGAGDAALRVYYPIVAVTSPTTLSVYRKDQVGIAIYQGLATDFGGYKIQAGARLLSNDPTTDQYYVNCVLEANDFDWQVGDVVECAHSSSMDISGCTWAFTAYSPGMTYRHGFAIQNHGMRDFEAGITVGSYGASLGGFAIGASLQGKIYGVVIVAPTAIQLDTYDGREGAIVWGSDNAHIKYVAANEGIEIRCIGSGIPLAINAVSSNSSGDTMSRLEATGHLHLKHYNNSLNPKLRIEGKATGRIFDAQFGSGSYDPMVFTINSQPFTFPTQGGVIMAGGSHNVVSGETVTGYMIIKDADGIDRKVAILS